MCYQRRTTLAPRVLCQSGTRVSQSGTKQGLVLESHGRLLQVRSYCGNRNSSEKDVLAPRSLRSSRRRNENEKEKEETRMSKKNLVFSAVRIGHGACNHSGRDRRFHSASSTRVLSPTGLQGTVTLDGIFTTSTPYGPNGGELITSFTGTYSDSGDGVSRSSEPIRRRRRL